MSSFFGTVSLVVSFLTCRSGASNGGEELDDSGGGNTLALTRCKERLSPIARNYFEFERGIKKEKYMSLMLRFL